MLSPVKIGMKARIAIGALLALLVAAGIWALAANRSNVQPLAGETAENTNSRGQVDSVALSESYKAESDRIVADFLAAAQSGTAGVSDLASKAQKDLLALSLPAQFKAKHLAEVILLGKIADSAAAGKIKELESEINELRQVSAE